MPAAPEWAPPEALVQQVAVDVCAFLRAGEYVYLHCGDGNGRSGVVAALVLAITCGAAARAAAGGGAARS